MSVARGVVCNHIAIIKAHVRFVVALCFVEHTSEVGYLLLLFGILDLQPKRTKDNLPLPMTFGNSTPVVFLHQGYWYADVPYASADMTLTKIEEKEFYRRKMAAINERNVK